MADLGLKMVAGASFGVALTLSAQFRPEIIVSQFDFSNSVLLQTFFSGVAGNCLIVAWARSRGSPACKPRPNATIAWFSPFDANIIGGMLIGTAMVLSGACPGTLLPQIAFNVRPAPFTFIGGILGGVMLPYVRSALQTSSADKITPESSTLSTYFNLDTVTVLVASEIALGLAIGGLELLPRDSPSPFHPIWGGLLISASQALSLVLTGSLVGASSAYEDLGTYIRLSMSRSRRAAGKNLPSLKNIAFVSGIFAGSLLISPWIGSDTISSSFNVSPTRALFGGFIMITGARLAGGCPSGHGMSGLPTFSISSILTIASIFVGGVIAKNVFGL